MFNSYMLNYQKVYMGLNGQFFTHLQKTIGKSTISMGHVEVCKVFFSLLEGSHRDWILGCIPTYRVYNV